MSQFARNIRPSLRGAPSGFTLIEVSVAIFVLSTLFVLVSFILVRSRSADDLQKQRQTAIRIVENALERAAGQARRQGTVSSPELPPEANALNDPRLTLDIGIPDSQGFSEVTVTLAWTDSAGQPNAPISLTAWLPAAAEAQP